MHHTHWQSQSVGRPCLVQPQLVFHQFCYFCTVLQAHGEQQRENHANELENSCGHLRHIYRLLHERHIPWTAGKVSNATRIPTTIDGRLTHAWSQYSLLIPQIWSWIGQFDHIFAIRFHRIGGIPVHLEMRHGKAAHWLPRLHNFGGDVFRGQRMQ